jgi:hypothetical protein
MLVCLLVSPVLSPENGLFKGPDCPTALSTCSAAPSETCADADMAVLDWNIVWWNKVLVLGGAAALWFAFFCEPKILCQNTTRPITLLSLVAIPGVHLPC